MQAVAVAIHTMVQIGSYIYTEIHLLVDTADYAHLTTKRAVDEMIIGANAGLSVVKMVAVECLILAVVDIDGDDIDIKIT